MCDITEKAIIRSMHLLPRPYMLATVRRPRYRLQACASGSLRRLVPNSAEIARICSSCEVFPIESVRRLRHEATVYDRLRSIQGIHVPVHLGKIDLTTPYYYEGICELVYVMFLSFGGMPISKHLAPKNRAEVTRLVDC